MRLTLPYNLIITNLKKPLNKLGLFLFIIFLIFNTKVFANHELEERIYSKMTDFNIQRATENLLTALETIPDGEKYIWNSGSYKGYVIPAITFINEEGYFCRKYMIKNPNKNTPLIQNSPSIPNMDSILRINASAPFLK